MSSSNANRDNNFNFLRLLFALAVILSHSTELAGNSKEEELLYKAFHTVTLGDLAVDGFFLLSGYLIVQSWMARPEIWAFLKKRVLRIYPAFIVSSLVCLLLVGPLGSANPAQYFSELSISTALIDMARLLQPDSPPVFQGQVHPVLNGAMWTISYEFKCYLAVLILGVVGIFRRRFLWLLLSLATLAIVASQQFNFVLPVPDAVTSWINLRASTFRFASFFFVGGCFYLYRDHIRYKTSLAIIAAVILLVTMFMGQAAVLEIMLPLLGGYVLFCLAFQPFKAIADFGRSVDMSYGVYLYGWPIQKLLLWYFPSMSPWILFPLSAAAALGLGWMSWHLIESPFLKLKQTTRFGKAKVALSQAPKA